MSINRLRLALIPKCYLRRGDSPICYMWLWIFWSHRLGKFFTFERIQSVLFFSYLQQGEKGKSVGKKQNNDSLAVSHCSSSNTCQYCFRARLGGPSPCLILRIQTRITVNENKQGCEVTGSPGAWKTQTSSHHGWPGKPGASCTKTKMTFVWKPENYFKPMKI